jgi:hypothetical protein
MRTSAPFSIISAFLILSFFLGSCHPEYSFEGGLQAKYTVMGSPAMCTSAVVSGFYIEGRATDSSNTLQVNVHVTTAGNYNIITIPVNGISFTASGKFADTGFHSVKLLCTGTPQAPGSYPIKIQGDNGCSVILTVLKKAPASYTLLGAPDDCSAHYTSAVFIDGKKLTVSESITIEVLVATPGNYKITTDTLNGVSFSSSGNFNNVGPQSVILAGNGTPDATGFFFFTVQSDSSKCSFSIPVQDGDPVATYVLQSGQSGTQLLCSPGSIQGIYTAGTPLNASNSITVSPYVTVMGNYTISTHKINGMIFSAHGTFPAIGNYNVVLQGSGTPLAVGMFTCTPLIIGPAPIGGASCDLIISVK